MGLQLFVNSGVNKMKQIYQFATLVIVIIVGIISAKYFQNVTSVNTDNRKVIQLLMTNNCDLNKLECRLFSGRDVIRLKFNGAPRTMHKFFLELNMGGFDKKIESMSVQFSMKSMDMGVNRFNIQRQSPTNNTYWQTSVLLPVCTSKRTDWEMQLEVATNDSVYKAVIPLQIK